MFYAILLISLKENEKFLVENLLSHNINYTFDFFVSLLTKSLNSYFKVIKLEDVADFYKNFL